MKTAIISQPFGIGDNIYTITICHHYINQGYRVIYPVKPHNVEGLQRAYPQITWIPDTMIDQSLLHVKEFKEVNGNLIVPLRWSDLYKQLPYSQTMRAKYLMMGMDYRDWKKNAMWERNELTEHNLYFDELGLKLNQKYNLISLKYGTDSQFSSTVEVNNGLPNIEMRTIEGFSLFDWATVIEQATYIHAVSSSIFYLLELLDTKAEQVHLYSRRPHETDFDNIRYLMTKNYVLHEERTMCKKQHLWGGTFPLVDEDIHQEQNVELIGKNCDCGKIKYLEGECSCPGKRKWEIKYAAG